MTTSPYYLYVHVPFCAHICYYCDFAHRVYDENIAEEYIKAVQKELSFKNVRNDLKTIYIGGGTPTSLKEEQLDRFLALLDPYRSRTKEYTIEINPETLTEEKVNILVNHGINRVSIGFQSDQKELLNLMGRKSSPEDVYRSMQMLNAHGIFNISLDIMYSLPHQTMEDLQSAVKTALSYHPKHLSLYSLTIEENTVFGKKGYAHLDEDTEADMYEWIVSYLEGCGFHQYETSNFSIVGHESLHNTAYWDYEDFLGIGCGASGKEGHLRYDHSKDVMQYIHNPCMVDEIPLTDEDIYFESVMMGLRKRKGIPIERYSEQHGISLIDHYALAIQKNISLDLLEIQVGYLRCTDRGYEILNSILVDFMD